MQDAARILRSPEPARPRRDEDALLRRARAGDRDAFEALAVHAMPMLLGSARRLLGDRFAAEEAVAEALFRALRHVASFRGEAGFGTWAHRILCRVVADRFRTRTRERARHLALVARSRGEREGPADPSASPCTRLVRVEERQRMRRALDTLPSKQRLVLLLHAWEGLALREVAEAIGMRYATVKSNLHHARRALRAALGEDALGEDVR